MRSGEESLSDSPSIVGALVSGNLETLSAGAELGNYRVIRFLGAGGMGAVYLAEHIHLSTRHALKTIRPEVARLKEFKERFLREAKLMARLKHPHIVTCTDAGVVNDTPYLVMDYIEGPGGEPMNLRELLDQRKARGQLMDEAEAVAVGLDICRALEYAHSFRDAGIPHGIIHRDLKPANILLDKETKLYITDFGLARLIGENFEASVVQAHALSMSLGSAPTMRKGQTSTSSDAVGTFDYMSPEQREGRVADTRCDVYALGAILYELLTGRKVVGVPTPPSVVRPGLSPIWDDIILERALAYEPDERYASAGELCRAIEQAYFNRSAEPAVTPVPPPIAPPPPPPAAAEPPASEAAPVAAPRPKKRKAPWVAGGLIATVAVAGLLLWGPWNTNGAKTKARKTAGRQTTTQPSATPATPAPAPAATTTTRPAVPLRTPVPSQPSSPVRSTRSSETPTTTTSALAALQNAEAAFTNGLGMRFQPVPGTEVLFSIWDTRVQDYAEFVRETGQTWEKPEFAQGPTHPVVKVSWNDATAFCVWLTAKERRAGRISPQQGYRLPQDWEWSVAVGLNEAKAGAPSEKKSKEEIYPWDMGQGRMPAPVGAGNYEPSAKVDTFPNTSPVGSFVPNQFGLFDMGGNVRQWCEDFYDGRSGARVLRGGTWSDEDDTIDDLMSSHRARATVSSRQEDYGFRVVLYASVPGGLRNLMPAEKPLPPGLVRPTLNAPHENGLGMKFVPVAGTKVLFSIWDTRVQDYKAFLEATGHSAVRTDFVQGPTHPAVNVSWYDADNFCRWLTRKEQREGRLGPDQFYRLPKDWEWSVAACLPEVKRGTPSDKDGEIDNVYPWANGEGTWPPPSGAGNYAPEVGVDSFDKTSPVGTFAANPHGLFDMGGDVWQWCEDPYDTADEEYRALRGGSWASSRSHMLSSSRKGEEAEDRHNDIGFRCALEVGANQTATQSAVASPAVSVKIPNDHPELDAGLIAHYQLAGDARDRSPNALHGINEGATAEQDHKGRSNGALYFDGKAQVRVPHDRRLDFTAGNKYTVACWVKRTGGASPQHIIGKRGLDAGWWQIAWENRAGVANLQAGTLPEGVWKHVAEVRDCRPTTCISDTYVDGEMYKRNLDHGFPAGPTSAELIIGGSSVFSKFTGMICDVRIYDRALSAAEIATLAGKAAVPAAFVPTPAVAPNVTGGSAARPQAITQAKFFKGTIYGSQWDVGACLARAGGTARVWSLSSSEFPADGYVGFSYNNLEAANPFTMTLFKADGTVNREIVQRGKFVAMGDGKCMFVANNDWTGYTLSATPIKEGGSADWPHTGFATPADYARVAAMGRNVQDTMTGGFQTLFNARDLTGWMFRASGVSRESWSVKNGVLVNSFTDSDHSSDLVTKEYFKDFSLSFEYQLPRRSNSGVYLRGCYEIQLCDNDAFPNITAAQRNGAIYKISAPIKELACAPERWHRMEATLKGQRLTVSLDGVIIHDDIVLGVPYSQHGGIHGMSTDSGPIILQGTHGGVSFRNIQVKRLD